MGRSPPRSWASPCRVAGPGFHQTPHARHASCTKPSPFRSAPMCVGGCEALSAAARQNVDSAGRRRRPWHWARLLALQVAAEAEPRTLEPVIRFYCSMMDGTGSLERGLGHRATILGQHVGQPEGARESLSEAWLEVQREGRPLLRRRALAPKGPSPSPELSSCQRATAIGPLRLQHFMHRASRQPLPEPSKKLANFRRATARRVAEKQRVPVWKGYGPEPPTLRGAPPLHALSHDTCSPRAPVHGGLAPVPCRRASQRRAAVGHRRAQHGGLAPVPRRPASQRRAAVGGHRGAQALKSSTSAMFVRTVVGTAPPF